MLDFVEFKEEVRKLNSLVQEGEQGCSTWWELLESRMSNVNLLYYGEVPSSAKN